MSPPCPSSRGISTPSWAQIPPALRPCPRVFDWTENLVFEEEETSPTLDHYAGGGLRVRGPCRVPNVTKGIDEKSQENKRESTLPTKRSILGPKLTRFLLTSFTFKRRFEGAKVSLGSSFRVSPAYAVTGRRTAQRNPTRSGKVLPLESRVSSLPGGFKWRDFRPGRAGRLRKGLPTPLGVPDGHSRVPSKVRTPRRAQREGIGVQGCSNRNLLHAVVRKRSFQFCRGLLSEPL